MSKHKQNHSSEKKQNKGKIGLHITVVSKQVYHAILRGYMTNNNSLWAMHSQHQYYLKRNKSNPNIKETPFASEERIVANMGDRDRGNEEPSTCDMLNDMMRGQWEFQQGLQHTLAQMAVLLTQHMARNNNNDNKVNNRGNNEGNRCHERNNGNGEALVNDRRKNQHDKT